MRELSNWFRLNNNILELNIIEGMDEDTILQEIYNSVLNKFECYIYLDENRNIVNIEEFINTFNGYESPFALAINMAQYSNNDYLFTLQSLSNAIESYPKGFRIYHVLAGRNRMLNYIIVIKLLQDVIKEDLENHSNILDKNQIYNLAQRILVPIVSRHRNTEIEINTHFPPYEDIII